MLRSFECSYTEQRPDRSTYSCRYSTAVFQPPAADIRLNQRIEQYAASGRGSLAAPRSRKNYQIDAYHDGEYQNRRQQGAPDAGVVRDARYPGSYAGYAPSSVSSTSRQSSRPPQKSIQYYHPSSSSYSGEQQQQQQQIDRSEQPSSRRQRKPQYAAAPPFGELQYVDEVEEEEDARRSRGRRASRSVKAGSVKEQVRQSRAPSRTPSRGRTPRRYGDREEGFGAGQSQNLRGGGGYADAGVGGWDRGQDYTTVDITPYHMPAQSSYRGTGYDSGEDYD